ncbi:DUF5455 family protein [Aeromonas salmonicida]
MQGLAAFFTNLLGKAQMLQAGNFAKDVSFTLAIASLFVFLFSGMWAGLRGITQALNILLPSWATIPFTWIIPNNFNTCVSAYVAGYVVIALYRWHMRYLSTVKPSATRYS